MVGFVTPADVSNSFNAVSSEISGPGAGEPDW